MQEWKIFEGKRISGLIIEEAWHVEVDTLEDQQFNGEAGPSRVVGCVRALFLGDSLPGSEGLSVA